MKKHKKSKPSPGPVVVTDATNLAASREKKARAVTPAPSPPKKAVLAKVAPAIVITEDGADFTVRVPGDPLFLVGLGAALLRLPEDHAPEWATFAWKRCKPELKALLKKLLWPLLKENFSGAPGHGPKGPFKV